MASSQRVTRSECATAFLQDRRDLCGALSERQIHRRRELSVAPRDSNGDYSSEHHPADVQRTRKSIPGRRVWARLTPQRRAGEDRPMDHLGTHTQQQRTHVSPKIDPADSVLCASAVSLTILVAVTMNSAVRYPMDTVRLMIRLWMLSWYR